MKFQKEIRQGMECYISGIYKCVKYGEWHAFFKPDGWPNWGNSCERTHIEKSKCYKTLKDAQAACKRHAKSFDNPTDFDKLLVK